MKVSVIIPCFNVEHYISECLSSVYSQSYEDIEVICVDNNSSDGTLNVIKDLKNRLYQNLIILEENKPGACAARNKGLIAANGEWIQFLDADDLILENKINSQVQLVEKNSGSIVLIVGAYLKQSFDGKRKVENHIKLEDVFLNVYLGRVGITSSNLWLKSHVLKAGQWNEQLSSSQETDLMMRMLITGSELIVDNEVQSVIRERESGQITQSNPVKRWTNFIQVRFSMLKKIKDKQPNSYAKYQNDYDTFLLSSIVTLSHYDKKKALEFMNLYDFNFKDLTNKFGISKKILFSFRNLGPKNTLSIFSKRLS